MEPNFTESHNSIMVGLGRIDRGQDGINHRLDTLNSSVAKHELRLGNQDVLNAQITLTQGQIVSDLKEMRVGEKSNNDFILRTQGSINTFKWLIGFIGIGTLLTLLKVLGFITYIK